ncbi:MAG: hypothetical protein EBV71_04595 [Chitinophagia bacterium]|nr:hypothetical protein [Chitinophagia bacterium]
MSVLDWLVLCITLCVIIVYGLYKSRSTKDLDGYFRSNRSMQWGLILLSIMGTQASAITFLSAPGQAYTDGMRFVQYYFGLPFAMIVIALFFVPVYHRLQVYTAYEYLENRFDGKTRALTSLLFLLQRGLSTGISVFAPSIILSSILGWGLTATSILMGGLLIIYTLSGGARAVAYTQQLQWVIIFLGLGLAGWMVVKLLPAGIGFTDALLIGDKMGKMNVISSGFKKGSFDWSDQYNIWSGLIGGFFLALSYFGTDQSQVGRYLTAQSIKQSQIGLLMNGLIKVPLQFLILLVGVLVFSFYQFNKAPLFFNTVPVEKLRSNTVYADSLRSVEFAFDQVAAKKKNVLALYANEKRENVSGNKQQFLVDSLRQLHQQSDSLRRKVKTWIDQTGPIGSSNDTNYIFPSYRLSQNRVKSTASYSDMIDHQCLTPRLKWHWDRKSSGVMNGDAYIGSYRFNTSDHYPVWSILSTRSSEPKSGFGNVHELGDLPFVNWYISDGRVLCTARDMAATTGVNNTVELVDISGKRQGDFKHGDFLNLPSGIYLLVWEKEGILFRKKVFL